MAGVKHGQAAFKNPQRIVAGCVAVVRLLFDWTYCMVPATFADCVCDDKRHLGLHDSGHTSHRRENMQMQADSFVSEIRLSNDWRRITNQHECINAKATNPA